MNGRTIAGLVAATLLGSGRATAQVPDTELVVSANATGEIAVGANPTAYFEHFVKVNGAPLCSARNRVDAALAQPVVGEHQ